MSQRLRCLQKLSSLLEQLRNLNALLELPDPDENVAELNYIEALIAEMRKCYNGSDSETLWWRITEFIKQIREGTVPTTLPAIIEEVNRFFALQHQAE